MLGTLKRTAPILGYITWSILKEKESRQRYRKNKRSGLGQPKKTSLLVLLDRADTTHFVGLKKKTTHFGGQQVLVALGIIGRRGGFTRRD
jgi:hypothetical protein